MQTLITTYYKQTHFWNVYGVIDVFNKFIRKYSTSISLTKDKKQTLITDYYSCVPKYEKPANNIRQSLITDFYKSQKFD